ncbi:inorganic phosphate transporter [Oscillatoria laete-virens NRMC-F 0139]|nr:inorganic phosphate transporter [Oscillatoria laete-virens]MDL5052212.1 inorganic phosphate transporter [Oscillatoria laete-virens NRMC-F 0139]
MFDLLLPMGLAVYVALNLGANDVANSMGTSVGSKAITLRQAIAIAGVLEFTGAVLFGKEVSKTLATEITEPHLFAAQPQVLLVGMIAVLLSCGIWLQIATSFGFPVASSQAVVGAIAGFSLVAVGSQAVDWSSLGLISLTWIVTPAISGGLAALFYRVVRASILDSDRPLQQLAEWIPWLSVILFGLFGAIVLPSIFPQSSLAGLPIHDFQLATVAIATLALTTLGWRSLPATPEESIAHQQTLVNRQMARFQVLSACFVAFAHGSNDVGNAIAPLAAITYIQSTGSVPGSGFEVPLWILLIGGVGIVIGLALWGKNVIATIGENITPLQPSGGFCAELATATTILLASRVGLPVSTSHALVGAVVGIGLVQRHLDRTPLSLQTLKGIGLAWIVTIPIAAGLGAAIFAIAQLFL